MGHGGQVRHDVYKLKQERFGLDNIFPHEDGQALEEIAHRGCAVSLHPWGFSRPEWIRP